MTAAFTGSATRPKTADIFAAADGYQPIEIRKDLNLSRNITLRLKPVLQ